MPNRGFSSAVRGSVSVALCLLLLASMAPVTAIAGDLAGRGVSLTLENSPSRDTNIARGMELDAPQTREALNSLPEWSGDEEAPVKGESGAAMMTARSDSPGAGNAGDWSETWQFILVKTGLTPHDPIYIEGDDDFTPANGVVGGSGTAEDPYIIENWAIDASRAVGIYIVNTTAYFTVRNCLVENGRGGRFRRDISKERAKRQDRKHGLK